MSSPEQESYSEGETDRSAWTGGSETLKGSEIERLRFSMFEGLGGRGVRAPGHSPVSKSQNVPNRDIENECVHRRESSFT